VTHKQLIIIIIGPIKISLILMSRGLGPKKEKEKKIRKFVMASSSAFHQATQLYKYILFIIILTFFLLLLFFLLFFSAS
jgi:hypothetical protein